MARFSDRMVTEVVQRFWAPMARREFIAAAAAAEAGTYRKKGAPSVRIVRSVLPTISLRWLQGSGVTCTTAKAAAASSPLTIRSSLIWSAWPRAEANAEPDAKATRR